MDKIWDRFKYNPSKLGVIGCCGGDGKPNDHANNRQKSNAKKMKKIYIYSHTNLLNNWFPKK